MPAMKKLTLSTLFLLFTSLVFADVRPAKIFADSMVLQRGINIPVWGWADKNEKITVQLNKQTKSVTTGIDGKWRINLDAEKEGGPYQLIIKGRNAVVLNNILVGDVWICSGQSNMEWTVNNSTNSSQEIASADFPMIRHIKIATAIGQKPWDDIGNNSGWKTAVPANVGNFTAVGYFFARELYQKLHVPIGLINTTWGGTDIETWISREGFENSGEFKEMMSKVSLLNLDSLSAIQKKSMLSRIQKLQGALVEGAIIPQLKEPSFNDSHWPRMRVPGLWEQQSLPEVDGIVWFRKTIIISAADAGRPADISLGMIDDNDETYLNGVRIGGTKGYNSKRMYHIPAGVVKEGKNVIAVRVEDTGGGGGLNGDDSDVTFTINDQKQSLAGEWLFQVESVLRNAAIGPNSYPTLLYNAMIHPLIPFAIKGALWYQGENNAGRAYQYRKAFPLMITDWRKHWAQGNFPFYFVQLASFNAGNGNSEKGSTWAELREAQTMTLSLPNTGMAVTTDIGEAKDIHPKNKQDVGKRLAAAALYNAYGRTNTIYSGPVYQSMKTEGSKVILSFNHTGKGLHANRPSKMDHPDIHAFNIGRSGELTSAVNGFEVAGADRKFYTAEAKIENGHVVLSAANVAAPVAARYAWADDAGSANLFNSEGFPAVPFRTDQWKGITEATKYRN